MGKFIDMTGQKFNRWTVLSRCGSIDGNATWNCLCSCGNEKVMNGIYLRNGDSKSCGCLKEEVLRAAKTTHGMYHHPAYKIWGSIRYRSTNSNDKRWEDYGGRGIEMCQEWEDSFEAFWADMGPTWREGLSLDRIDNDKGYYKENCRWTTNNVQAHNKRKQRGCTSEYMGVFFNISSGMFRATIQYNRKHEHIGCFTTDILAATAYDNRSEEIYGDRPNGTIKSSIL